MPLLKSQKTALILLSLAIAISVVGYAWLRARPQKDPLGGLAQPPSFNPRNFTTLRVDSFVALAQKAYGSFLKVEQDHNEVLMEVLNSNELAKDFFNGNDSLLRFRKSDFGFHIQYNSQAQTVQANFDVEEGGVHVPNDVLIKMLDKISKPPTPNSTVPPR